MNDFYKEYEDLLRKDKEKKEREESLTVKDLLEVLKQADPMSIVKISNWENNFTVKNISLNNGIVTLYTF